MCSIILKVLFLGGLVAGVALTAIALGTQYWRVNGVGHIGLTKVCVGGTQSFELKDVGLAKDSGCMDYEWKDMSPWRRAVICLLGVALLISLFAFGWWLLACIGCCCQDFLTPPLPFLGLLLLLLDAAAVITYACLYSSDGGKFLYSGSSYGYSFWCAVAAICSFGLTVLLGCGVVGLAKTGRDRTAYRSI